ncbi:hypothetical protein Agub_g11562 [Astrephomene gubernaculifera]|uniref:Uncharacterized protein n=1 Tax=Astrephomene gubernaculifera TaxID=47775 RepID=A0AAD3HPY6_9CHLO|nr:hypothetical protein Agub_g11562 [Astrephomene gubernaculifera]
MMAAQLSTSLPSDSLLYSFTPAVCSRGGTPSPPPVVGSRRARTQSVTGESVQRLEVNDSASDLQLSPRSPSILHLPGRAPGGGSGIAAVARSGSADRQSMAATLASISIGPGNTNPNAAANATTPLSSSSTPAAAAAAAPTAVASVMPLIVAGSSCCPGSAGSPRHPVSSSSSPTAASTGGLPKLEHPGGLHACGGNGGGVGGGKELPALIITGAGRRYSHSGGTEGCTAGVLESPTGGGGGGIVAGGEFVSGVAAVALRQGMLAPLRAAAATSALHADVVSAGGGGGGGGGGAKSQGWCGGGGAGGSVPSSSRRSSIAGPLDIGPIVLPCGISSPYTAACDVPSPVTPSPAASPAPLLSPPGRHPGPMAPLPGSPTTATAAMHVGRGLRADCSEGGPAATAADDDEEDDEASDGSSGDNLYCGSSAAGGGSTSSTIAHLRSINDDLQRAAGALSALHALPTRSRSDSGTAPMTAAAASSPPPPPPAALTGRQLQALKESAPELHSELRIAVRRAFQVICQEVARSAPRGRKLGSCVHECWATLDAFLEGTAELTSVMVENALAAAAVAPAGLSPHPPSAATSGGSHHGSGCHGGRHHPSCGTEGPHSHDPVREVERMRAANMDLQQQLEECQARLATAEATSTGPAAAAASTPGEAGGAHTGSTRAGCKGGGGTCPRPPAAFASPPQETCPGTSPRRGRHARAQQQQQQPRRESDPGVPSSTGDPGDGGFVSAGGGAPCAPREGRGAVLARTGSVVESCSGGRQVTFAAVVAAGNGSSGGGVESPRLFGGRTTQLTSSSSSGLPSRISSHAELVIEDDSSEEEAEEDGEEGTAAAGSSLEARRRRGLMHSASFAEWMEGRMAAAAAARRR